MASQTANQILTRAMRRIKQIAAEEAMDSAELADGLVTMNGLMHGFGPKGIGYAHIDLLSTDAVNVPDEQVDNLVWMVAEVLAPEFGYTFTSDERVALNAARQELQAAYLVVDPAVPDTALRSRRPGFYNFSRGQ